MELIAREGNKKKLIAMYFSAMICSILVTVIKEVVAITNERMFSIRTEGCNIEFPKISDTVRKIVGEPPQSNNCTAASQLVTSNSSHIWVVDEALPSFNVFREDTFYCCYRNFSALHNLHDITYGDCKEFVTVIEVEHEFVRIECYYLDEIIYYDFFLFTSHEDITPETSHSEESYNILILGIESMSRLNFHRTMTLTSNFLKERGIVELFGYNKLGDNSFPNLFPILTGHSYDYLKQTCIHGNIIDIDQCEIIWDKFKEKGFHTALGSDSIAGLLGNYEYNLPRIPTHSYLQPFIYETRQMFKDQHYSFHQCMGSKFYFNILLDYIYDLTRQLKQNRMFGMFWEESVSHEYLNSPHIMDQSYLDFLTNLERDNYLNRTILILLSDHGMRWGEIIYTTQGRLEGRLPLLGILFPEEFRRRYKLAFLNIQQNVNRLTTPHDIYETVLDLLNPSSLGDNFIRARSDRSEFISAVSQTSLFLPVSATRNCSSIGIDEHWCACRRGEKLKVGNNEKTIAANNLVLLINKLLNDYPQCHKLVLGYIYDVYLVENNKQRRIYTVTVKTWPAGGIFDGTLINDKVDRSHWVISGTVSRLNRYRNQSDCVTNAAVKLYCYCG